MCSDPNVFLSKANAFCGIIVQLSKEMGTMNGKYQIGLLCVLGLIGGGIEMSQGGQRQGK